MKTQFTSIQNPAFLPWLTCQGKMFNCQNIMTKGRPTGGTLKLFSPLHLNLPFSYHSQILEWCWCGHDCRIESALVLQTWFWHVRLLCSRIFHVNKTVSSLNLTSVYFLISFSIISLNTAIHRGFDRHNSSVGGYFEPVYSPIIIDVLDFGCNSARNFSNYCVVPPCTPPLQNLTAGSLNLR